MAKITLYNAAGDELEIEDTPRKREWAKGKGHTLERSPIEETPDDDPVPWVDTDEEE